MNIYTTFLVGFFLNAEVLLKFKSDIFYEMMIDFAGDLHPVVTV